MPSQRSGIDWNKIEDQYIGPSICLLLIAGPLVLAIVGGPVLIALHFLGWWH